MSGKHRTLRYLLFGSFRRQLILAVALVYVCMVTLFILDLTSRQKKILLERQHDHAVVLMKSLATSSAVWLVSNNVAGLQEIIDSQQRYPDLSFAMLTKPGGLIMAHTDRSKVGLYLVDLPKKPIPAVFQKTNELFDMALPIMLGDQHIGWVRVGISQKSSAEMLSAIYRDGILYTVLAVIVGSLMAWAMGRAITARLYAIQSTINEVKSGNSASRIHLSGIDEAATLGNEFNAMLDTIERDERAIRKNREDLQEINANLENLVSEKTKELSRSLADLAETEERFRTIFEDSPDAYLIMELDRGRISDCNRSAEEMLRGSRAEIVGKTPDEVSPLRQPDGRLSSEAAADKIAGSLRDGRHRFEWVHQRLDGTDFWAEVTISVITISKRQVLLVAWRDITKRKQIENELAAMVKALGRSNNELEQFAYAVSHDLRAPLRHMRGFSRILMEDFAAALPEAAREFLNEIDQAGVRMGALIDGLLQLSRSTRGDMQKDRVDISAMSERILAELAATPPERQVEWSVEPGLSAWGDARMLEVVMVNLLGNSWKYTDKTPQPIIRVYGNHTDRELVFCVSDNGAGFDMEYANKLFMPFQRLHRADEFPGIGIGLATVQRIVHRHGGIIQASAVPGQGATFSFTLPHTDAINARRDNGNEDHSAGGGQSSGRNADPPGPW